MQVCIKSSKVVIIIWVSAVWFLLGVSICVSWCQRYFGGVLGWNLGEFLTKIHFGCSFSGTVVEVFKILEEINLNFIK